MIEEFLNSCKSVGAIDSYTATPSKVLVKQNGKSLMVYRDKGSFFLVSSASVDKGLEVRTNGGEKILARVLASKLLGTRDATFAGKEYHDVSVYPTKVLSSAVEFSTARGKTFLVNSSNTRITLGLYDILYSTGGEHSILMLPDLFPKDPVPVASSFSVGLRDEFLSQQLISSVGDFVALPTEQKTRLRQNFFFYGKNQKSAVDVNKVIGSSTKCKIASSVSGYQLDTKAIVSGVEYQFSGTCMLPLDLVMSELKHSGGDTFNLKDGFMLAEDSAAKLISSAKQVKSNVTLATTCSYEEKNYTGKDAAALASRWSKSGSIFSSVTLVEINY